jgi:hypothetical protein
MTTFIREQETKEVLNNYREMSTQGLLDYLMLHHYDGDCQYIFNHLPKDLQDDLDALAGEMVKIRDQQIADVQAFNKRLRAENYQIECEIENVRDIRRQLDC